MSNAYIPAAFDKGRENHSKEELNETATRAQAGDEDAKRDLGVLMQPYVIGYLRRIGRGANYTHEQRNELTQEAWVGVFEALKRWDPSKGVKFSTYAYHWMRHYVMEWVASNTRSLRLPRKSWHYALRLAEAWEDQHPTRDIWEATDEEIRDLTIFVERQGETVAMSFDGERGTLDAVDIVRALRQPYSLDPDSDDSRSTASAEEDFFEEADDLDSEAIAAVAFIREALEAGDEDMALTFAEDFVEMVYESFGLDIPVSHIMDVAEGPA